LRLLWTRRFLCSSSEYTDMCTCAVGKYKDGFRIDGFRKRQGLVKFSSSRNYWHWIGMFCIIFFILGSFVRERDEMRDRMTSFCRECLLECERTNLGFLKRPGLWLWLPTRISGIVEGPLH
jgi:hypothetical protein